MKRTFPVALTCLLLSAFSQSVQAEYVVMYEDLYPTTMMQARAVAREQPRPTPVNHPVQFARGRSQLGSTALRTLYEVSRNTAGTSIVVVGRPDVADRDGNMSNLARNRAMNIRDYLTRQGVAASSITIETEDAPNSERNSDVQIAYPDSQPASPYAGYNARPPSAAPVYVSTRAAVLSTGGAHKKAQARVELLQLISKGIQSGEMRPTEAIELLRVASDLDFSNEVEPVSQPSPVKAISIPTALVVPTAQPVQAAIAKPIEIIQMTPPKIQAPNITKWEVLDSDVTLKNTLSRWGKEANWEILWENIPEFRNQGYTKLSDRDFLSATDYILKEANEAANAFGFSLVVTAYVNRVLVVSKESKK